MATVVKQLQSQFKVSMSINAGNLLSRTSEILHIKTAGHFLNRMQFDIVACGDEEINLGLEKLHKELASRSTIRFLCLNSLQSQSIIVHQQVIEKNGYRFLITSLVNETACGFFNKK